MADNDGNGRVTMAVLGEKLDNLDGKVTAALEDAKKERTERENIGTRVTRLEERMGIWGVLQAVYSTGVAAIAAWIGAKK